MYDLRLEAFTEVTAANYRRDMGKAPEGVASRRLTKLRKKHRAGLIEEVDWLDRLAFREIEAVNEAEKRASAELFLVAQFPVAAFEAHEHAVLFFEPAGAAVHWHQPNPPVVKWDNQPHPSSPLKSNCSGSLTRRWAWRTSWRPSTTK